MDLTPPQFGEPCRAAHPSKTVLRFLSQRRSALAKLMGGPGPSPEQVIDIISIAARVPDHRKLGPWRFIILTGDARTDFGAKIVHAYRKSNAAASAAQIETERNRFLRAPTIVTVISSPKPCRKNTPIWEQQLSAGAVCFNMLLAARAMGFAGQWLTEWPAYNKDVERALAMASDEQIAGFIYLGQASAPPRERARPEIAQRIELFGE